MRLSTLFIAATALAGSIASAHAVPSVRAGVLECRGGQNVGFVVGSVANLECIFQSPGRRPPQNHWYDTCQRTELSCHGSSEFVKL